MFRRKIRQLYVESALVYIHNHLCKQKPVRKPEQEIKPDSGVRYSIEMNDSMLISQQQIHAAIRSLSDGASPDTVLATIKKNKGISFVDKLQEHIRLKSASDASIYRAAHIDRRLFSKIMSNRDYKPEKDTCLSLIFALELSCSDAIDVLNCAGYSLSRSNERDIVMEFFLKERIFRISDINAVLFELNMKPLGRE